MIDTQEPSSIPGMSPQPVTSWQPVPPESGSVMPESTSFQSFPLQSEASYETPTVAVAEENNGGVPGWIYIFLALTIGAFFLVGTLLFISLLQKSTLTSQSVQQQQLTIQPTTNISPTQVVKLTPMPTVDPIQQALSQYSQQNDIQTLETEINQTDVQAISTQLTQMKQ
jgi:hypothetical protein